MAFVSNSGMVSVPNLNLLLNNFSNPYFLHHEKSLGSNLVSQLLNGENYDTQSRSKLTTLNAKNKAGFVNETFLMLANMLDPLYIYWFRCDNMVLSWILDSLSKEIVASVISTFMLKRLEKFKNMFYSWKWTKSVQLKNDIASLAKDQYSMSAFLLYKIESSMGCIFYCVTYFKLCMQSRILLRSFKDGY